MIRRIRGKSATKRAKYFVFSFQIGDLMLSENFGEFDACDAAWQMASSLRDNVLVYIVFADTDREALLEATNQCMIDITGHPLPREVAETFFLPEIGSVDPR